MPAPLPAQKSTGLPLNVGALESDRPAVDFEQVS